MATRKTPKSQRQLSSEKLRNRAFHFIEELSWVLESYKDLPPREIVRAFEREQVSFRHADNLQEIQPANPNLSALVGCLPTLLMNTSLFPNNEAIVSFSESVLHLEMRRWHKKSRYDLIGHVVCYATELSDESVKGVVSALAKIVSDEDAQFFIAKNINENKMSWNELIQIMNNEA